MIALALAALLAAAPAAANPQQARADYGLCLGLGQTYDRVRGALAKGSEFPSMVSAALGDEQATQDYLGRGVDVYRTVATVSAQCRATFGPGAGARSDSEAAAIRRRVTGAKRAADAYLSLPSEIRRIDEGGNEAEGPSRQWLVKAMVGIAEEQNFDAAATISDKVQSDLALIRNGR